MGEKECKSSIGQIPLRKSVRKHISIDQNLLGPCSKMKTFLATSMILQNQK